MIKEYALKWVEALRSKLYKQGEGQLRYEDNYCVLGVACDLFRDNHEWKAFPDNYNGKLLNRGISYSIDGKDAVVPTYIMEKIGLRSDDGVTIGPYISSGEVGAFNTLAEANDAGISFEELADYIENYYEYL